MLLEFSSASQGSVAFPIRVLTAVVRVLCRKDKAAMLSQSTATMQKNDSSGDAAMSVRNPAGPWHTDEHAAIPYTKPPMMRTVQTLIRLLVCVQKVHRFPAWDPVLNPLGMTATPGSRPPDFAPSRGRLTLAERAAMR